MPIKQAAPRQHHFMQITSQQIEEIRAGKIKTFEILFNAYYPRVKSFAFGMIKDQYEAEEIAQNVFLKLWSNREKLSSDNTLSSYIFTIVQNEVYDFFREKHYSLGYQEKMLSTPQNLQYEIDSEYNIGWYSLYEDTCLLLEEFVSNQLVLLFLAEDFVKLAAVLL